jgi:hypothetical protein
LQDFKIGVALFSETYLKPYERLYSPNHDIYRTDRGDRHNGGNSVAVMKDIPHTCVDLLLLLSVEATGFCISIGNTEMFLAAVL